MKVVILIVGHNNKMSPIKVKQLNIPSKFCVNQILPCYSVCTVLVNLICMRINIDSNWLSLLNVSYILFGEYSYLISICTLLKSKLKKILPHVVIKKIMIFFFDTNSSLSCFVNRSLDMNLLLEVSIDINNFRF